MAVNGGLSALRCAHRRNLTVSSRDEPREFLMRKHKKPRLLVVRVNVDLALCLFGLAAILRVLF